MKHTALFVACLLIGLATAKASHAVSASVDFEDLTWGSVTGDSITLNDNGVDFTFTGEGLYVYQLNYDFVLEYGFDNYVYANGMQGPITVTFSQSVSSVSFLNPVNGTVITGVDENGFVAQANTIEFNAFDATDNLLAAGASSAETIAFAATGIQRIVLAAPESGSFVFGQISVELEDFTFPVVGVPVPAAFPLMLAGVGVFAIVGWRRRRAG